MIAEEARTVVDILLAAMLSGGHLLIESPAGIGKTTLAKTFAQVIGSSSEALYLVTCCLWTS